MTAPLAATVSHPADEFPRPPAEDFWQKYSRRFEFPLSWTAAVLVHVLAAVGLVVVLPFLAGSADRGMVPVTVVAFGDDDADGGGEPGGGGLPDPVPGPDGDPFAGPLVLPAEPESQPLPAVTPTEPKVGADEPKPPTAKPGGGKEGEGNKPGTGGADQRGKGKDGAGGGGGRSLRWSLRFKFEDSREYLQQLAAAKAVIVVPLPPDNKTFTYIGDLDNPKVQRPATAADLQGVRDRLKFFEHGRDAAKDLLKHLDVAGDPKGFYICFPKEFERELERKEAAYQNLRPEDIKQTVFKVTVRDGKCVIEVVEQKRK